MPDKKITALVDGGAPQATDEFVVARAGDNFKLDFASVETEVLSTAVVDGDAAGGVLGGTYPNPGFAVDMATQVELDAHINDPTDAHAGSAIGNIPAGTIAATDVQAAINELDGQIATSLDQAVILAPAASTRNVIVPTAGAVIAAILKNNAAQSVDLLQMQRSDGSVFASVSETQRWFMEFDDSDFIAGLTLKSTGDPSKLLIEALDVATTSFYLQGNGQVFIGATEVDVVPITIRNMVGQTGDLFITQTGLLPPTRYAFKLNKNGRIVIGINDAPADGDLNALDFSPWYDATNGAARFMAKAKTADGTVVTWTIPNGSYIIGTDIQAFDATLQALAGTAWAADALPIGTGADTLSQVAFAANTFPAKASAGALVAKTITDFGLSLVDDANAAAARTTLDVPSNAEAILDTFMAAKGDLITATANDTPAILTAGTDTHVLTADSTEATGIKWAAVSGSGIPATIFDAKGDLIAASAADTAARLATGTDFVDSLVPNAAAATGLWWSIPRDPIRPAAAMYEIFSRQIGNQNAALLSTQRLSLYAIRLPAGLLITNIAFMSGDTAMSVGVVQLFGLYDSSRNLLRGTADDGSTAWAANTVKTLALTSTFTTTYSGVHYLGILVQATTVPSLQASVAASGTQVVNLAPILWGTSNTGVTTLPNPANAISAATRGGWGYVS